LVRITQKFGSSTGSFRWADQFKIGAAMAYLYIKAFFNLAQVLAEQTIKARKTATVTGCQAQLVGNGFRGGGDVTIQNR
jgi:hypothetical protein